jgi:hypothetical protein
MMGGNAQPVWGPIDKPAIDVMNGRKGVGSQDGPLGPVDQLPGGRFDGFHRETPLQQGQDVRST